jgi:hypothetical protein
MWLFVHTFDQINIPRLLKLAVLMYNVVELCVHFWLA